MANLINPVSLRLSYNCYWNNIWSISSSCNYSYINMLDFCLWKYFNFLWDKLKWYRRDFLLLNYRFFRFKNIIWVCFNIRCQDFLTDVEEFLAGGWVNDSVQPLSKMKGIYKKYYTDKLRKAGILYKFMMFNIANSLFFTYFKYYLFSYLRQFLLGVHLRCLIIINKVTYLSANFIARYVKVKLIQRFPFRWVMNSIVKRLRFALARKFIFGFKILISGRFSRRDRSTHCWKAKGKVPLHSVISNLDFSFLKVYLLNSVCGIKVWINIKAHPNKLFVF